jgi:hypothetical protein
VPDTKRAINVGLGSDTLVTEKTAMIVRWLRRPMDQSVEVFPR